MTNEIYDWIPFYIEFADKLLEYKDNRNELIDKVLRLWDNIDMKMPKLELDNVLIDIDPFTIFGLFNKQLTDKNRIAIINYMKNEFSIEADVPKSFTGIPVINPQKGTFYWFKDSRGEDDIDNLWKVFEAAINFSNKKNKINRKNFTTAYNKVLTQYGVKWNITMALYWIRPYDFLNLDSRNRQFLSKEDIFGSEFSDEITSLKNPPTATKYLSLIEACKEILDEKNYSFNNLPELSYEAYVVSNEEDKHEKEDDEGIGDSDDSDKTNYWLYSPGPGASKWDKFYKESVMALAANYLNNLDDYASREDIVKALQKHFNNNSKYPHDSLAFWQFAREIKKGDIIFAKKGRKEIVGYGIVESEYYFDNSLDEDYAHAIKVNWIEKGKWSINNILAMKTLTNITDNLDLVKTLSDLFESSPTDIEQQQEYPQYDSQNFLEEVFISENEYKKLTDILFYKKNLILQGPPGVGKTFIAKRLAYSLIGSKDKSKVTMVQFHQSYSYEDFITGIRPEGDVFTLKEGIFYKFCKEAQNDPDNNYYFIIDEINRGNLSKIFGELFMLIENDKRGKNNKIQLLYKDELFYIPKNVYIIGMMNTADRSLAMLDYALRRRFTFYKLSPAFDNENFTDYVHLLNNNKFNNIITVIKDLNDDISQDETLGEGFRIGHSYFTNLSQENVNTRLEYIIEYEIIPLLEEYWFDDDKKVKNWTNILRSVIYDSNSKHLLYA